MTLCPITVVQTPTLSFGVRTEMLPPDVHVEDQTVNDEFVITVSEEQGERIKKYEDLLYARAAFAAAALHWDSTNEAERRTALEWSNIFEPKIVMEKGVPMAHLVPPNEREEQSIDAFPFNLPCWSLSPYQMMAYEFFCVSRGRPISFREDSLTAFSGKRLWEAPGIVNPPKAWANLNQFCHHCLTGLDLSESFITGSAIVSSIITGAPAGDDLEIVVTNDLDRIAYGHYQVFASRDYSIKVTKINDEWHLSGEKTRSIVIRPGKYQDIVTSTTKGFYDHRGFVLMASAVMTALQGCSPDDLSSYTLVY